MNLDTVRQFYEENELSCEFDHDGNLVIQIRDGFPVDEFVPIAQVYLENFSEIEAPLKAFITNKLGDQSKAFIFNSNSELELDVR